MKRDVLPVKVAQFLADCSTMTASQRGAYILLLVYSWNNGGRIPSEPGLISVIAGLTMSDWEAHSAKLGSYFAHEDGWWVYTPHAKLFDRAGKIAKTWADRGLAAKWHLVDQTIDQSTRSKGEVSGHSHGPHTHNERGRAGAHSKQQPSTSKASKEETSKTETVVITDGHLSNSPQLEARDNTVDKAHSRDHASTALFPTVVLPDCPHTAIVDRYVKNLPGLRVPREWGPQRQLALRTRWREAGSGKYGKGYVTLDDGLAWWDRFFRYIAERCPSLSQGIPNKTTGRVWTPDLEWMLKHANFVKIIEGAYESQ